MVDRTCIGALIVRRALEKRLRGIFRGDKIEQQSETMRAVDEGFFLD